MKKNNRAFTLLETAIIISVVGLILAGGLAIQRVQMVKEAVATTKQRMTDIRGAMDMYQERHKRRIAIASITKADPGVITTTAPHTSATGNTVWLAGIGGMTELNGRPVRVVSTGPNSFQLTTTSGMNLNTTGFSNYTSGGVVIVDEIGPLPCPASLTAPLTSSRFGREDTATINDPLVPTVSSRDCFNTATPNGTVRTGPAGARVRIGAVPVSDLGLPSGHIMDKWGRRFIYAVSEKLADKNYMPYNPTNGAITLKDETGAVRSNKMPYVLLSLGKGGHGGTTYEGANYLPCTTVVASPDKDNCDMDTTFRASSATYSDVILEANRFDDIVFNYFVQDKVTNCGNSGTLYGVNHAQKNTKDCTSSMVVSGTGGLSVGNTVDVKGGLKTGDSGIACGPAGANKGALRSDGTGKPQYCDGAAWKDM